jgi:hypothetical protein
LFLTVGILVSATPNTVGAVRIQTPGKAVNENDVKVVNAFTNSFEDFIEDVSKISEGTTPNVSSFGTLQTNGETLQKHTFKDLNDEYTTATDGIKQNAGTVVSLSRTANTTPVNDETVDLLNDAMDTYNTQITAMTSAVSLYQDERTENNKNSNNIFWLVVGGIVALVIVALIINFIRVGKKVKGRQSELFANDPAGASIPADKQKMVAELLNNLYQFEKEYKSGNQQLIDITRKTTLDPHYTAATDPSLGKFRAVAFEYAALAAIAAHNDEQARGMLAQAEQARGDRNFYTETARNYAQ